MREQESIIEFPCQFPIKAMGKNVSGFDSLVVGIIQEYVDVTILDEAIKTRISKGDKYLSITVMIEANSREQLDAIYQRLTDCPEVLMAL